jgi:hypothetical protein
MLFRIALVLLTVWLLGVIGVFNVGDLVHTLLLLALLLLLVAVLRARDAAMQREAGNRSDRP